MTLILLPALADSAEIWKLDNLEKIGGHPITVVGKPEVREESGAKFLMFDGVNDGIFVPSLPVAGARQFTIELLFRPANCDLLAQPEQKAQRFLHLEDKALSRALMETRVTGKGTWYLDHFMYSTTAPSILAMDENLLHPTDRWYWLALRWDGKTLTSFINGKLQLERPGTFPAFGEGQISIGVRQNKVSWFKGAIGEVRFHKEALTAERLQRLK